MDIHIFILVLSVENINWSRSELYASTYTAKYVPLKLTYHDAILLGKCTLRFFQVRFLAEEKCSRGLQTSAQVPKGIRFCDRDCVVVRSASSQKVLFTIVRSAIKVVDIFIFSNFLLWLIQLHEKKTVQIFHK